MPNGDTIPDKIAKVMIEKFGAHWTEGSSRWDLYNSPNHKHNTDYLGSFITISAIDFVRMDSRKEGLKETENTPDYHKKMKSFGAIFRFMLRRHDTDYWVMPNGDEVPDKIAKVMIEKFNAKWGKGGCMWLLYGYENRFLGCYTTTRAIYFIEEKGDYTDGPCEECGVIDLLRSVSYKEGSNIFHGEKAEDFHAWEKEKDWPKQLCGDCRCPK